jgi:hypothetical protein
MIPATCHHDKPTLIHCSLQDEQQVLLAVPLVHHHHDVVDPSLHLRRGRSKRKGVSEGLGELGEWDELLPRSVRGYVQ